MTTRLGIAIVLVLAGAAPSGLLLAQNSRCADCHFANRPSRDDGAGRAMEAHLQHWEMSAHSRNRIGCERCHGGDPTTFEPALAHRGILHWRMPASPVNRANIPRTCGTCHAGPFVAFQSSRHYALLQGGNPVVPTCTTCHGYAGENRPSPAALERECATCHRPGRTGEHPEFPALGRQMLEGVRESRAMLSQARTLIARVKEPARRARLEDAAQQVEVPLVQATQASHAFVYDVLEQRLTTARRRLSALFDDLANPPVQR
jgi:hypothetical protein